MTKQKVVELEHLRTRLREAEEVLSAIRMGEVDSLIVAGPHGDQVFSLKGAEQPYRAFVEQMLEGAVTLTRDGTILYSNRRFAELLRSPLERVIGNQLQSFVQPTEQKLIEEILTDPQSRKVSMNLAAADGSNIPVRLSFNRMPVEEDVEAISLVVTDMTEHEEKRELTAAMQRLQEAQDQLRKQNDELDLARTAAEAANEAKDNFLAALSHELRTPLAPVLNGIEILTKEPALSEDVKSLLGVIRRNVELEARLIDDLLDLTRIVRGKIELKPDPLDVHAVLSDAIEICRSALTAKGLHLDLKLDADSFQVSGDAVRIQQILWNLLRNAIKFTPEGGRITVHTRNDGESICLAVSDTGIGIDNDSIHKIFIPFEQASRLITRQFGGLGLGLAISKRLAELHGGTVTAQSDGPGRGATFIVTLPTTGARGRLASKALAAPEKNAQPPLRILLVEDHDDTRRSMAIILGRKHLVGEASSIESALTAAGKEKYDLVISDLGLPDGSGFELMRQLRKQYKLRGICLSGYGMEHDVSASAEAGFDHHLIKPVDPDKLQSVIDSLTQVQA